MIFSGHGRYTNLKDPDPGEVAAGDEHPQPGFVAGEKVLREIWSSEVHNAIESQQNAGATR